MTRRWLAVLALLFCGLMAGRASARDRAAALVGAINVNAASADELCLLPGVGPARAEAMIAYRQRRPFRRLEELRKIRGIGAKTYARIRMFVRLDGRTTLRRADDPGPDPAVSRGL